ncbi:MAG TPA: DUF456 family protein [Tepidisphaeraceae bacterium]|nr:DUF456 family protein [Tepidisphaeraceae bacterium]
MDWLYYVALWVLMLTGLFLNVLGLPGLWLMVASLAAYAWATGWNVYVGWPAQLALLILALGAEAAEFVAGAAGSKAAGGSKRGMVGALVGGLVGGIVGTGLIPVPIVGTIAGACIGSFIGAGAVELMIGRTKEDSAKIGWGAAKGRLLGIVSKSMFGVTMMIVAGLTALPLGTTAPAALPPPATLPATAPATGPVEPAA